MNGTISLQINKCRAYVDFMLRQQQWSGLSKPEVERWLRNFDSLSPEERLLVYKLLANLIYFSENDVIAALREGIHKTLYYNAILCKQLASGFALSEKALANTIREELEKSCFIPLLDSGAPHESGNYVTRTLVQQGIIPQEKSVFITKLPEIFKTGTISKLVIVDDCVGSGQQLTDFWQKTTIPCTQGAITLQELCAQYNVDAHYLTLFGYDVNIARLQNTFNNLTIHCVRLLTDDQRVFSDNAYIWKDTAERDTARNLFEELCSNAGVHLLGYRDLDFAFIMHRTIPDWTLPLFWMETANWNLLMRRKNSHG